VSGGLVGNLQSGSNVNVSAVVASTDAVDGAEEDYGNYDDQNLEDDGGQEEGNAE